MPSKIIKLAMYYIIIPLLMWILSGYSIFLFIFLMFMFHTLERRLNK